MDSSDCLPILLSIRVFFTFFLFFDFLAVGSVRYVKLSRVSLCAHLVSYRIVRQLVDGRVAVVDVRRGDYPRRSGAAARDRGSADAVCRPTRRDGRGTVVGPGRLPERQQASQ